MQNPTQLTKDPIVKERYYDLYKILGGIIPEDILEERNFEKSWNYGYHEEYDLIVISKDGTIGDIYEIENLRIAIPAQPEDVAKIEGYFTPEQEEQYWKRKPLPNELRSFKSMYGENGWLNAPKPLLEKYDPYIREEFRRRMQGFWFYNNGRPTYITGHHYMYLQWSPIDIGYPQFWLSSMISYYHWEACKADERCYGQIKVKCRRSGWSHEASSDILDMATLTKRSLFGIVSKTGGDAKSFFTSKTVAKFRKYPFFFKPLTDGTTNPKQELAFVAPAERITARRKGAFTADAELDTYITWQTTQNNSYDSEKLKMLIEDECFSPDTKILCEGFVFKEIKDINVGDKVIVDGGKIKTVMKKFKGRSDMYFVKQPFGIDYTVSQKHRLVLNKGGEEIIVTPKEYLRLSNEEKSQITGVTAKNVGAPETNYDTEVEIKPIGIGDYIGIQVDAETDDERRLILEDFTVSMNCGKWDKKLGDILNHWGVVKETLRTGRNIVGKCKMGTTVNPPNEGGDQFKILWEQSDPRQRMSNGQTKSGLYRIFIRAEYNYEGFIDIYGYPVLEHPIKPVMGIDGKFIDTGALEYFDGIVEDLKSDPEQLNEFLRKNPREIADAFRVPGLKSPFVLANIYDQRGWNNMLMEAEKGGGIIKRADTQYSRYNFLWKDDKKDTEVEVVPDKNGRFYISWLPPLDKRNMFEEKDGVKKPTNDSAGCFGVDPIDISQTNVEGRGSDGAIVGVSRGKHMGGCDYGVFLEYAERPVDVNIFFDDVIKCCVFYGMKILPERDKARLLYEMKARGYRGYVMNRPDQEEHELKGADKEIGGYPSRNSVLADDMVLLANRYTYFHLGMSMDDTYRPDGTYPVMPFNRLLDDLEMFDPTDRTKSDLTIAFMSALLGLQGASFYARTQKRLLKTINIGLQTVKNY